MRKYFSKFSVKITAIFVSSISFLLLIALVTGIFMVAKIGIYSDSPETFKTNYLDIFYTTNYDYRNDCRTILQHHLNNTLDFYNSSHNNLYTISIGDRVIESTYNGEDDYIYFTTKISHFSEDSSLFLFDFNITIYYPSNSLVNISFMETLYNMRYTLIVVTFILFLIFAASLTVFLYGAGHKDDFDTITLRALDKIPFDINTIILAILIIWQLYFFLNIFTFEPLYIILGLIMVIIDWVLLLNYITSFVILLKAKELAKRTLLYSFLAGMFRSLKKVLIVFVRGIIQLPLVWKTLLALTIFLLAEYLVIHYTQQNISSLITAWIIGRVIFCAIVLNIAFVLRRIQKAGRHIAEGNTEFRLDTSHMLGEFKKFGDDLNSISEGMGKAVEDKLKSERFKTELITNVSHDIKTPLTSIINYVDLIKKEKPENENVKEYTQVLDRQSTRLKKLIEDLIEASKASTGNLKVTLVPCELNVLLAQIIGEYEEILAKHGLELVSNHPNHVVNIMADGRHLWRVIDNLMNNIRKYTMPGTRVYVSLVTDDSKAYITFRNISKSPLNISSEELMERFTRGDSSRNTEGSGLGLSIAKSLTELQGGKFELEIDGDLFKAKVTFDLLKLITKDRLYEQ